jgi:hypothetical protein
VADSPDGTAQVGFAGQAALNAYAARYFLRSQASASSTKTSDGSGSKAAEEFRKVLARVGQARPRADSAELDALLIDTAPSELKLAGTREEVASDVRRPPAEVQRLLVATLTAVHDHQARLEGLRRIVTALLAAKDAERIRPVTLQAFPSPGADQAEALATAGLELLRADMKEKAEEFCRTALQVYQVKKDDKKKDVKKLGSKKEEQPELRSAVVALAMAVGQPVPKPRPKDSRENERVLVGTAAGQAWLGQADKARQTAVARDDPEFRFRALLEIADQSREKSDVEAALDALLAFKKRDDAAWTRRGWPALRMAWLAQKVGLSGERQEQAVAAVPVPLTGWAQLAMLRERLSESRSVEGDELAKGVTSPLAHQVAWVELAWHNTHLSSGWGRAVDKQEDASRPFASLGVALGMQGKR